MRTVVLVLSFPSTNLMVLFNSDLRQQNYIAINSSGNYYSDLSFSNGYTDTVLNNGRKTDNKFHVYIATGMNWGNLTTLYFGAYWTTNSIYPLGTRIAAICIYNRIITTTEINTIQSWFNSRNFNNEVPILTLNGSSNAVVEINNIYTDLGVSVYYILNPSVKVYITSIVDQNNSEYIITPINALSSNSINNLNTNLLNYIYRITYSVTDLYNNIVTITRTLRINLAPIGITLYSTSKPNVFASTSTKTSNTIYYYGYNNYRYTSTDFIKFTFNSNTIYYMDSNQVVSSNIVTTDNNGILWTTIGLITMQVYNVMNFSINYNNNSYNLYYNPNILLMSNGIYKNNNGSDYVYQYNNNWYYSTDMITFYQILFDSTNTIVQGISSNIIYLYNNMVLTSQPVIHTLNSTDYWIFGIMRVNPINLTDCCLYYNNTIYYQQTPNNSLFYITDKGSGNTYAMSDRYGSSYFPTYLTSNFTIDTFLTGRSLEYIFTSGGFSLFPTTAILYIPKNGFVVGGYIQGSFVNGTPCPTQGVAYSIKSDGTTYSDNIFGSCLNVPSVLIYRSLQGGFLCRDYLRPPTYSYTGHSASDGNFTLSFIGNNQCRVVRIVDGYTSNYSMYAITSKRISVDKLQYVIWVRNNINHFDPHSFSGVNLWNQRGYISFETSSYFCNTLNPGYQPKSWNADTLTFVNGGMSVSCTNLNFCGYINPVCLEPFIFSNINNNSINNNNINNINIQPLALPISIQNHQALAFSMAIPDAAGQSFSSLAFAVAIPANRSVIAINPGTNYSHDFTWTCQNADCSSNGNIINFLTNIQNFIWNN